jgi:CheY-like chemotaxis protein
LEEYLLLKPRIGKKILICIVSSSIDPEDIEKVRAISEVTDCVLKPVTQEKFINLIKTL